MVNKQHSVWLLFCTAFVLGRAQSQCKYYAMGQTSRQPLDVCVSGYSSSYMYSCDKTGKNLLYKTFQSADCSGLVKIHDATKWKFISSFQCKGQTCGLEKLYYNNSQCAGKPEIRRVLYADKSFCITPSWNKQRSWHYFCDKNVFYDYDYGTTDGSCSNNASSPHKYIGKTALSSCKKVTFRIGKVMKTFWEKETCLNPTTTKPALTFSNNEIRTLTRFKGLGCLAQDFQYSRTSPLRTQCETTKSLPMASNFSSVNNYCSAGTTWTLSWDGAKCGGRTLQSAFYFNTGCASNALGLFSPISNTTSYTHTCSGPPPPVLQFASNKFALLQIFADAACSKFLYGFYIFVPDTCSRGSLGSSRGFCTPSGGVKLITYNNPTCNGVSVNNTAIYNSTCTRVSSVGVAMYATATGCGQGSTSVDPKQAPNVNVLKSGVQEKSVLCAMLGVLVLVFWK